jgi:hypothetical protein
MQHWSPDDRSRFEQPSVPMTRTSLLLTHAAVFSVGLASAMIANSVRESERGKREMGRDLATRTSSRAIAHGIGTEANSRSARGSDPSRDGGGKSSGSTVDRLGAIVRMTDSFARQRALMDMIDSLGADQFAAVAEQFRTSDHFGDSGGEFGLILKGWAKLDPMAALDYVGSQTEGRGRGTILETWAGSDPGAAERWALDNFTGEGANPFMTSVIRGIAGNDLALATRLTEGMPASDERGRAIGALTDALFLQGIDAAKNFPASITDDAMRGGLISMIGSRLANKNPEDAAQWLASIGEGADQQRAARNVADALAKTDPTKAATWLKSLQPEARGEAARGIIPVMASGDINNITQTATWVASLAGTPGYDHVVEEFVWSCNTRAPEQSAAWIQGVTNVDQQRRLYHRMLGEWAQKDAGAVKQWVAANSVPDDIRRRFSR